MNWIIYGFGFTSGVIATAIGMYALACYRHKKIMAERQGMHEAFKSFISSMEEHSEQESKEVH